VCLPVGWIAKALETSVDWPVFRWINPKVHDSAFTSVNDVLTRMGNHSVVRVVCALAAIGLAIAWRRRFYVPVIVIAVTFILEKYEQSFLAKVIDRGHPPTSLGTFPSGGCARVVSLYGVIVFLGLALAPTLARRWHILSWTALALAAWLEAFSRLYLSKHWLTDVVGGLIFGTLLLLVMVAATAVLIQYPAPDLMLSAVDRRRTSPVARTGRASP
jgi:membrane-associated phospholipid phosphatase